MRGHEPLIAMRMRGLKPEVVSVSTDPLPPDVWRQWPEYLTTAQVEIEAKDRIPLLDLRWAINLPFVWVGGASPTRVEEAGKALKAAGAKRVVAMVFVDEKRGPRMVSMQDSEGVLTWQA